MSLRAPRLEGQRGTPVQALQARPAQTLLQSGRNKRVRKGKRYPPFPLNFTDELRPLGLLQRIDQRLFCLH